MLSEPDYYTLFVRAWIPINAWYVAEMPQLNKVDRDIIRELQDNLNSKPKLRLISLLLGSDYESGIFKYNLAQLHINLEKRFFLNNNQKLSFKEITLTKNPIKHKNDVDKDQNKYKAECKSGYFEALIVDKHTGFITFTFPQKRRRLRLGFWCDFLCASLQYPACLCVITFLFGFRLLL